MSARIEVMGYLLDLLLLLRFVHSSSGRTGFCPYHQLFANFIVPGLEEDFILQKGMPTSTIYFNSAV